MRKANHAAARQHDVDQRKEADDLATFVRRIGAQIPEFIRAARELNIRPEGKAFRKAWIVGAPIPDPRPLDQWPAEHGGIVGFLHITVKTDGTWFFNKGFPGGNRHTVDPSPGLPQFFEDENIRAALTNWLRTQRP